LKHIHRLIVDSATYRQSSRVTPELLEKDPANRLLAHGPRMRVDAETMHDIALESAGLLSAKVGGPSVYPPIPEFLLKPPVSFGNKSWPTSTGEDRYRRGMYIFHFRTTMYPELATFDAPTGETACVRRVRSNTPLQALVGLNEPMSIECAQGLARRTLEEGGSSDESRLTYAFRRCVSRMPTDKEKSELLDFYQKQKQRLAGGWLNSWQLLAADNANPKPENVPPKRMRPRPKLESSKKDDAEKQDDPSKQAPPDGEATQSASIAKEPPLATPTVPKDSTPTELAAWTCVARVLLNLDETITKE